MAHLRSERQQELAKKFAERLRGAAELKVLVETVTPPATPNDRQRLYATVNSQQITSANDKSRLVRCSKLK